LDSGSDSDSGPGSDSGPDSLGARGYAMGAVRAQAYGPPTLLGDAQGSVPSVNLSACGPNCARTAPIVFAPLARDWGVRGPGGNWGGFCRCRPVGRQVVVEAARLPGVGVDSVGIVWPVATTGCRGLPGAWAPLVDGG